MLRILSITCLMVTVCAVLMGCDGGVFPQFDVIIEAGDNPGDGGDGGGTPTVPSIPNIPGGGGGDQPAIPTPFQGTWFAAWGDRFVETDQTMGFTEYVARMTLTQDANGNIEGTGTMYRTFLTVPTALQEIAFTIIGFTRGENDAQLTFTAVSASDFELDPVWQVRVVGSSLEGVYAEITIANTIGRTGHATWYKGGSNSDLPARWGAAWEDVFGTEGFPRRDRIADLTIAASSSNTLSGTGQFVELRPGDVVEQFTFDVVRGLRDTPFIDPTFGNLDLAGNEFDWVGFHNETRFVGSYAQRGNAGGVVRWGHAIWTPSGDVSPNDLSGRWITAFSDSNASGASTPRDFLAAVNFTPTGGNVIEGSRGALRDQSVSSPTNSGYTVTDGLLVGNRFTFKFSRGDRQFDWDCHFTGGAIHGIYQLTDTSTGDFLGRGHATWRLRAGGTNFTGSWAAAYTDTVNEDGRRQTQLVRFTITDQDSAGNVTGTGVLRFAGEDADRTFGVSGGIDGQFFNIVMTGPGLSGGIEWQFRRASTGLHGVYENQNTAGGRESRGAVLFRRTADQ